MKKEHIKNNRKMDKTNDFPNSTLMYIKMVRRANMMYLIISLIISALLLCLGTVIFNDSSHDLEKWSMTEAKQIAMIVIMMVAMFVIIFIDYKQFLFTCKYTIKSLTKDQNIDKDLEANVPCIVESDGTYVHLAKAFHVKRPSVSDTGAEVKPTKVLDSKGNVTGVITIK